MLLRRFEKKQLNYRRAHKHFTNLYVLCKMLFVILNFDWSSISKYIYQAHLRSFVILIIDLKVYPSVFNNPFWYPQKALVWCLWTLWRKRWYFMSNVINCKLHVYIKIVISSFEIVVIYFHYVLYWKRSHDILVDFFRLLLSNFLGVCINFQDLI